MPDESAWLSTAPRPGGRDTGRLSFLALPLVNRHHVSVPGQDVSIRALSPTLQLAARELILDGLIEHWGNLDRSLNQDLNDLAENHDAFLVALAADGQLIGTGGLRDRGDGTGEVVRMSVRSDWRRKGVGRLLLQGLIEAARDRQMDRLVLETTASWREVREFYEQSGFAFTHEVEGPFGVDAYYELRV